MFKAISKSIFAAYLIACTTSFTWADDRQPQAEILHWWSSEGESAALSVFIDEFKSRGGLYYDSSKNDEVASREEAIERMGKNYPATFTQWNAGNDLFELYDFGLLRPIQSTHIVEKLRSTLPSSVLEIISYRDEIVAIPLNIHAENWLWYSKSHLTESDINLQGNWNDFIKVGEALAEKKLPLLAVGHQRWQVRLLFTSVFLGVSRDRYKEFYLSNNTEVVDTGEFITTLEVVNKLARYSQSFNDGNWKAQIKAVAEDRAAASFMGDWARAEFRSLGLQAGKHYGCQLTSTHDPSLLIVVDALVLGKLQDESDIAGQELMLEVVTNDEINLQFNALKGSISPYSKPNTPELDSCTSQVYAALGNKQAVIPPYQSYFSEGGEFAEYIDSAIYAFWTASLDPDSDSRQVVAQALDTFRALFERRAKYLAQTDEAKDK